MSIYLVGRLLGWTIVIGYTLTMLNFVLKRVNRLWIMKLPKDSLPVCEYLMTSSFIVAALV